MAVLRVVKLAKIYGIRTLFKDVSFEINKGDKVGFVGANGAGKSTLIKILMGFEESDTGAVNFEAGTQIGYVEQQANFPHDTLYDELYHVFDDILALEARKMELEALIADNHDDSLIAEYGKIVSKFEEIGGYNFENRIKKVAFGLGFSNEDLVKDVSTFSGGQKTRICLAKALIREPDFLFLDEPTNHLDIHMIEWLENFLLNYKGSVLLISHDRYFLDKVANRIFELENQMVTVYNGNYTYYMKLKNERRTALKNVYDKQQEYIRKTEDYIRRYSAGIKSKQARGRESQLKRLERISIPPETAAFNYFAFSKPMECAQRVLELEDIEFSYGDKIILNKLSLLIRRNDGVGLVGDNGEGKTTLLKLIVGELEANLGRINIGNRVRMGYFSQQHDGLHSERTVLEEILYEFRLDEETARRYLGAFLFQGDEVFRYIGELSGGEKARVSFLKLMLTGANFLILDEPTNHLDIPAREAVEEALMAFPGTFIAVSHDRYFLDKVTGITLELQAGKITEYLGNYSYYQLKRDADTVINDSKKSVSIKYGNKKIAFETVGIESDTTFEAAQSNSKNNNNSVLSERKRQDMINKIEAQIAMAEMELKGLDYEMNRPETQNDIMRSQDIADEYNKKELEINKLYAQWAELT